MLKKMMHNVLVYMSRQMIACDEASFLISYRVDHRLGFRQWVQLRMHLVTCHLCRKYASQIDQLNRAVDHYREKCSTETCHHHLPEESRTEIGRIVSRELNVK